MMYNKIKEFRAEKNKTQEDLARETGYSLSQIRNIERNRSIPTVEIAIDIARILGKKVEEIFIKEKK